MRKRIRRFSFNKLVRDKIVGGIISVGNKPSFKVLSRNRYIEELKKKLVEEAKELPKAKNQIEIIDEIVDVEEIIDNLLSAIGVSRKEIKKLQKLKNIKRGSFKNRHFIDYVETKEGSEWIDYYLSNPEKYPEIK